MTKREPVRVTDHAVLRYLERVMRFDIAGVRRHIQELCEPIAAFEGSALKAEGARFVIANNTVITVEPDSSRLSKTTLERAARRITADRAGVAP